MQTLKLASILALVAVLNLQSVHADQACPNFAGIYNGECKLTMDGAELQQRITVGFIQDGCSKFIYNDLIKPSKFYTTEKATLYIANGPEGFEEKRLRRASSFDNGNTLQLSETLTTIWPGHESTINVGTAIFKLLDNNTISYDSERFDLLNGKQLSVLNCPALKK